MEISDSELFDILKQIKPWIATLDRKNEWGSPGMANGIIKEYINQCSTIFFPDVNAFKEQLELMKQEKRQFFSIDYVDQRYQEFLSLFQELQHANTDCYSLIKRIIFDIKELEKYSDIFNQEITYNMSMSHMKVSLNYLKNKYPNKEDQDKIQYMIDIVNKRGSR